MLSRGRALDPAVLNNFEAGCDRRHPRGLDGWVSPVRLRFAASALRDMGDDLENGKVGSDRALAIMTIRLLRIQGFGWASIAHFWSLTSTAAQYASWEGRRKVAPPPKPLPLFD